MVQWNTDYLTRVSLVVQKIGMKLMVAEINYESFNSEKLSSIVLIDHRFVHDVQSIAPYNFAIELECDITFSEAYIVEIARDLQKSSFISISTLKTRRWYVFIAKYMFLFSDVLHFIKKKF